MKTTFHPRIILLLSILLNWSTPGLAQTRVQAQPLGELKITVNRSVPAEVLSLHQATLASQLNTLVVYLPLLVGDRIEKAQLIARLDCADSELGLSQARSELAALEANRVLFRQQLDRLLQLRKSNSASEEQVNQKQAELNVANARISAQSIAIDIATRQVEKCEIRAPFSGVVSQIHSEVGNFVTPGTPIASLVDTRNVELEARVSDDDLDQINQSVRLHYQFGKNTYPVAIRTTLDIVNPATQNRRMRLVFPGQRPLPGAIGRLQWFLPGKILPASLMVTRDQQRGVFVVDTSNTHQIKAQFVPLPGARQGQPATVDLEDDALIIVDGRFGLSDGEEIVLN